MGALVVAPLIVASTGTAAPERAERSVAPRSQVVRIEVDGDPAAVLRTRAVASELLGRLGLLAVVTASQEQAPEPERRGVLVRAYFDLRDPLSPRVVVIEGESEREIVRRTLPENASLEMSVEALSHVLYVVVESLLQPPPADAPAPEPAPPAPAPAPSGRVVAPAPPPSPPAPPPSSDRESFGLEAGAFFRLLPLAGSRLLPGGGLSLHGHVERESADLGVLVLGAAHGATEIDHQAASASVRPLALRVMGTAGTRSDRTWSGRAALGAGFDWFAIEPVRSTPDTDVSHWSVLDLVLSSAVGGRLRVNRRFALDAALSLDLDLTPHTLVATTGDERSRVLELERFRAAFTLGASYSLMTPERGEPGREGQ